MSDLVVRAEVGPVALVGEIDDAAAGARYYGAVTDALRRAHRANPEINEALSRQVELLIGAADLYGQGVAAGWFAKPGDNQWSAGSRRTKADLDIDHRRISEGRKLKAREALAYIDAHMDEPIALGALLLGKAASESFASVSDEWYTPADILDAARGVLGDIDLDPASSSEANEIVRAKVFWAGRDDPLARDWFGRVFLNPPFTRSVDFVTKLMDEHTAGRVEAAVLVINGNRFDAHWFHALWDHLLCFTYRRPAFRNPLMSYNERPMGGTAIVYLGANRQAFIDHFTEFGAVVERAA